MARDSLDEATCRQARRVDWFHGPRGLHLRLAAAIVTMHGTPCLERGVRLPGKGEERTKFHCLSARLKDCHPCCAGSWG